MDKQQPVSNPFELMMDPQRVIQAMERSDRLARLQRRICRPLDKPLLPVVAAEDADDAERAVDELDLPGEEI